MESLHAVVTLEDQGGRRSVLDRRSFFTPECILERRSRQDRRSGLDRRIEKEDFVNIFEPKRKTVEYVEFLGCLRGLFHGICFSSLLWGIMIISIVFIGKR